MEKSVFSALVAVFACLGIVTSMAVAQAPARKAFGRGHPFQVEELPDGKLKTKLRSLKPQAREKAMKWLHEISFEKFDAAENLRVDPEGGVFIVCPNETENHAGHAHAESEPISGDSDASGGATNSIDGSSPHTALPPITASVSVPVSSPPAYNSKPGAANHIYLDFNGAIVAGKQWNVSEGVSSWDCSAWGLDSDPTTFSDAEQAEIRRTWERISEDYAPFDMNVTTDVAYDPDNYTGDKNHVGWLLFTETTDKNGVTCPHNGFGGIAYVGVFGNSNYFSDYQPAWVKSLDAADATEAGSHEMGHNMGLSHDGTSAEGYYDGHGATGSAPSAGPIMGTGYGRDVTQWSKGEYHDANQLQDDLAIISARTPYRTDDHANSFNAATVWINSVINQNGIVERTNDADCFKFTTGAGTISFNAAAYKCDTSTWGSNLDIHLELYDSTQTLIASSNPAAEVDASISQNVAGGQYYLVLRPSGAGSPSASTPSGYTLYGSLGQYTVTGSIIPSDSMALTAPHGGESWVAGTSREITWASGMGGNVKIELLRNGVLNSTIVASTPNDALYNWAIPPNQAVGTDYRIRITSIETPAKSDMSFSDFAIMTEPTLADALDTTGRTWTNGGSSVWLPQSTTTHDGIDTAQSGVIGDGESSTMETVVTGPGNLTFWWKVSSESGYDYLRFYLDGVEQTGSLAKISGEVDWVQKSVFIPSGNHTVKWDYAKNSLFSSGSDAAWVDQFVFTPSFAPEIAVEQPVGTDIPDNAFKSFGNVALGASTSLTYTIKNIGKANLTGIGIIKNGTHAADFTVTAAPAATVIPGGSTTFVVKFTPAAAGTRSAAIQIISNDSDENRFDIAVTGTGFAPDIAVDSIADGGFRPYGSVLVGSSLSLSYTIRNAGTANLTGIAIIKNGIHAADFTVTAAPAATVIPGGSTSFVLKFTPGGIGTRSAAIQIVSNDSDENPFDIAVTGTGSAPEIAVDSIADGGSRPYGSVLVGSSLSLSYTIRNAGTANLTGIAIIKNGIHAADFTVTTAPVTTVAPGGSTTFVVKFAPGGIGTRSAAIQIISNDSDENPFDIAVTGTGSAPEIAVQQPLGTNIPDAGSKGYGRVLIGSSKSLTYTIKNTGTANLTGIAISKTSTNAGDFAIITAPAITVAPGGSTTFVVKFTPKAIGSRSAAIHIANSDSDESPFDIAVTGTGVTPEIVVQQPLGTNIPDAGSKGYGRVLIGSSKSLTFTIKNTGTARLTGIAITKKGTNKADFTVITAPASSVAPGGKTTFVVKFAPRAIGSRNAAIRIANNDRNERPFDISLSGAGTKAARMEGGGGTDLAGGLLGTAPGDISETVITVNPINRLKYLTFEVMKAPGTADQRRVVEVSSNLLDWYSGRNHTTVLRDDPRVLQVRDNTPHTPGVKRYIRLRQPQP